jgi:AcrR family transcriptional regulator
MEASLRKQNILKCSKELFSQKGFYDTQISDIIKDARIARGTIYQYFKNKDDIFITLIKNFYDDWIAVASLDSQSLDLKTISPKDYFRHRVKQTLIFLANDPYLCNIVLRIGLGLQGDLGSVRDQFEEKINTLVKNDLLLGIKPGNVKKEIDVELVSKLLTGAMLYIAHYYFVQKNIKKTENEISHISEHILATFENIFN